jgi:hypothetical protein
MQLPTKRIRILVRSARACQHWPPTNTCADHSIGHRYVDTPWTPPSHLPPGQRSGCRPRVSRIPAWPARSDLSLFSSHPLPPRAKPAMHCLDLRPALPPSNLQQATDLQRPVSFVVVRRGQSLPECASMLRGRGADGCRQSPLSRQTHASPLLRAPELGL